MVRRAAWLIRAMMHTFVLFVIGIPVLLADGPSSVERQLDLRTAQQSNPDEGYFVVFCARNSKDDKKGIGHAFVVWARNDALRQLCVAQAFGFYPAGGKVKKAVFGTVPGALSNEAIVASDKLRFITHRLTVRVDRDTWNASQKRMKDWKTQNYNLFGSNCTHFVYDVAGELGLVVSTPNVELPAVFLSNLIQEAKKRE